MSTVVTRDSSNPDDPKLNIIMNNGDLGGLDRAMKKWNFKDEESLLKFSIAVLLSAKDGSLYTRMDDGKKQTLSPVENLLKTPEDSTNEATNEPTA